MATRSLRISSILDTSSRSAGSVWDVTFPSRVSQRQHGHSQYLELQVRAHNVQHIDEMQLIQNNTLDGTIATYNVCGPRYGHI